MADRGELLYLCADDIAALGLTAQGVTDAVEAAFRDLGSGRAHSVPKVGFRITAANFFHAMPARLDAAGVVGIKWIGTADNRTSGLPHINAMIVLSDFETAQVRAVMDGTAITALRPAVISLVAARRLARQDARRIGFIACGVQARAHLDAFCAQFPIREVTCHSASGASALALAALARERGLTARVAAEARDAVAAQDIVISSPPRGSFAAPFLDPRWLDPGAFVSGVDLGRSWRADRLRELDLIVTDDRDQSRAEAAQPGVLPYQGDYDADLAELASGRHPGRTAPSQRTFLLHPGLGLGDIAIAALVLERAAAAGVGTRLPR
ncbi:MAG: ornithine cyclodeaminase family protein [Burkholderiales bacterium]|nr:ornithine cyclodeaminase family protein [Burkholderiales bacterium]